MAFVCLLAELLYLPSKTVHSFKISNADAIFRPLHSPQVHGVPTPARTRDLSFRVSYERLAIRGSYKFLNSEHLVNEQLQHFHVLVLTRPRYKLYSTPAPLIRSTEYLIVLVHCWITPLAQYLSEKWDFIGPTC